MSTRENKLSEEEKIEKRKNYRRNYYLEKEKKDHPNPRGRRKIYNTLEEAQEANRQRAKDRYERLKVKNN